MFSQLRLAARGLLREPGFTFLGAGTLALGIAASTAVFDVVDAVYLRPLPFEGSDRLLRLRDTTTGPDGARARFNTRGRSFRAIAAQGTTLESVIAMRHDEATLTGREGPERVSVIGVTDRLTRGLGVRPALGRDFDDAELDAADGRVALIASSLFNRRFGGDPSALGRPLPTVDGSFVVIGVLPPGFRYPYDAEIWTPARIRDDESAAVFARMKPGITLAGMRADLAAVALRYRAENPDVPRTYAFEALPIHEDLVQNQDRVALALLALVCFFLLIACADVASLLLARAVRRRTTFAIRAALGARRRDEIALLLGEGLVLASIAGAAGVLLSAGGARVLGVLVPTDLGDQLGIRPVGLDGRLLAFALGVSCLTAVAAALAPAFDARRSDLVSTLKGTGAAGSSPRRHRLLSSLVVVQIALASSLLSGAGLLTLELRRLQKADLGVDTSGLLALTARLPRTRYPHAAERVAFVRAIEREVGAVPGVAAFGSLSVNPLWGGRWLQSVVPEGEAETDTTGFMINHRVVTPGAFRALGVRILAGRAFGVDDGAEAPAVVVVSQGLARRLWGKKDPLGRRVREFRGASPTPWRTVVGVAADVRDYGEVKDAWYLPYEQAAETAAAEPLNLMVRGAVAPASLAAPVEKAIWRVDPDLAFSRVETATEGHARSFAREKTGAATVAACAAIGVVLSALGLFGLVSYATNARRREIGVRIAVGASRPAVARLVLVGALRMVVSGLAIGAGLAWGMSRLLSAIVIDVPALRPELFSAVALLVTAVCFVACAIPARRAARLDPVNALRTE